jgi:RNA recognition motif-containing protein
MIKKSMKKEQIRTELTGDSIGQLHQHGHYVTVYIGNLSYKKTPSQLKTLFQNYGPVSYVNLVKDKKTNKSKGYAFVQMRSSQSADKAVKALNATQMDGRTLKVSKANNRFTWPTDSEAENTKRVKAAAPVKPKVKKRGLDVLKNFLNQK